MKIKLSSLVKVLYLTIAVITISFNASAQDVVTYTAKDGDGIYGVLRKNGIPTTRDNIDRFIELNHSKLGKSSSLFIGMSYILPNTTPSSDNNKGESKSVVTVYTARNGDNVHSVLKRFGFETSDSNIKRFIAINRAAMGKRNTLLIGNKYTLPSIEDTPKESIDSKVPTVNKEAPSQISTEITTPKTYKAKSGDNIYTVLKKFGLSGTKSNLNNFISLNKKSLGRDDMLIIGRIYTIPEGNSSVAKRSEITSENSGSQKSLKEVKYPLFGKKYERVQIVDNKLAGATYYLMSGHGGPDPGAIGKLNGKQLAEDEYAYDVTLRMGRELISHGAKVYFIIQDPNDGIRDGIYLKLDKDEICYPTNRGVYDGVTPRLKQRCSAVNSLYSKQGRKGYSRVIATHVDARKSNKDIDIFFYHNVGSKAGKACATTLRNTIRHKYQVAQPNRGYKGTVSYRNLYVLRSTAPPAIYIELGNIHHVSDQKRLIREGNRQAIADWLTDGLIEDYSNSKR